jgi:threonine dehydratase
MVIGPVGGGGLLAGTTLAVKGRTPGTKVIGVEPERADDARRSLETGSIQPSGDPKTIADGLRTSLGPLPFSVIRHQVDAIVTATEAEIIDAMRFVWERFKIIIEPSGAVPVAPVLTGRLAVKDRRVGIILSGGNVDLEPMFQSLVARWLS